MPVTAALAVTGALLLTACGGSDGDESKDSDKIAGAEQGADKPEKSADPSGAPAEDKPDGVDLTLPKSMNLVFDWNKPKDKNEAAAMSDAANFFRAIYRGVDKRTTDDAAVTAYSTADGLRYAKVQIKEWIDGGWTATGTLRHYQASTRSSANGKSVEVSFCADSSKFYGKEIKSGKVLKTEGSIKDFDHYKIIMVKYPTGKGLWQASKVFVETKAEKCR
ncbi:hypothetical protein [Streptomyces kanamyceticus]|uniref:Uncharacterized protein n=1 Tax=Streptomyces kanamyceticus TaxID=1967 RepID=A0A5J6GF65_STRKN|nr:hypothetical protein [Streptomyces kanamyceticus]QEU92561.1 hypothetical protein CP970_18100 [Streptomyces kanamyceticus]